jgi:hypothetical protein
MRATNKFELTKRQLAEVEWAHWRETDPLVAALTEQQAAQLPAPRWRRRVA